MKKYEYMHAYIVDFTELNKQLNMWGEQGWELIEVHDIDFYFKRELTNTNDIIGITSDGHYVKPYDTNKDS